MSRSFLYPLITCLAILLLANLFTTFNLIHLHNINENWYHHMTQECPKGSSCEFRNRYKKQRIKRKFGKVLTRSRAQKELNKIERINSMRFRYKKKSRKINPVKNTNLEIENCFICFEKPQGFLYTPCLHSGICLKCGLNSLKPAVQVYSRNSLKCPICRGIPKSVVFYKDDEEKGGLCGLGLGDLAKEFGVSQAVFEATHFR